jgi:hypothetical protein
VLQSLQVPLSSSSNLAFFLKYLFVYCLRFKKIWSCFSKFILYEQMADNFEAEAKNLRDQFASYNFAI